MHIITNGSRPRFEALFGHVALFHPRHTTVNPNDICKMFDCAFLTQRKAQVFPTKNLDVPAGVKLSFWNKEAAPLARAFLKGCAGFFIGLSLKNREKQPKTKQILVINIPLNERKNKHEILNKKGVSEIKKRRNTGLTVGPFKSIRAFLKKFWPVGGNV